MGTQSVRRRVRQQRSEQARFDDETAALVTALGGDPRLPLPELDRPQPLPEMRSTVMPNLHEECMVCRSALPRGQMVNAIGRRWVHLGRCTAVVAEALRQGKSNPVDEGKTDG